MPTKSEIWSQYRDHINTWFFEPDHEAIRILLANCYAHTHLQDPPVWIFIIGPSGSGKTRLGIDPYSTISRTTVLSQVTPASFISVDKSRRVPVVRGLLPDSGNPGNQIWLFKDFTTFLNEDHYAIGKILSILREVHDGQYGRRLGQTVGMDWRGRITIHAACTPVLEERLAANREFGERFFNLRWPGPTDVVTAMDWAARQNGHHDQIRATSEALVKSLIETKPTTSSLVFSLPPVFLHQLNHLIALFSLLSREGRRNGRHQLMGVSDTAFPSRLRQGIQTLVQSHCLMFDRTEPGPEELSIAYRMVLNTIPLRRLTILKNIPSSGEPIDFPELLRLTSNDPNPVPKHALKEDLEVLELIDVLKDDNGVVYFTSRVKKLLAESGLSTNIHTSNVIPITKPAKISQNGGK